MASKAKGKAAGFDALSDENREWLKEYEEKGWRVRFDEDGWHARNELIADENGDEFLGAFESFMVMMNTVEREENRAKGIEEVEEDAKGNKFLPGMGEIVVPELVELGKRRIEIVARHKAATQELIEVNEDILNAAEKYRDHFSMDEGSGSRIYKAAGIEIEIQRVEKDRVKTRLEYPDDEE